MAIYWPNTSIFYLLLYNLLLIQTHLSQSRACTSGPPWIIYTHSTISVCTINHQTDDTR